jgi:hypothetical protein
MKSSGIKSLVVGDEQELSYEGRVFYSGPCLSLIDTLKEIRAYIPVGLLDAKAAWLYADKEIVRNSTNHDGRLVIVEERKK